MVQPQGDAPASQRVQPEHDADRPEAAGEPARSRLMQVPARWLGSLRTKLKAPVIVTAGRSREQLATDLQSRLLRPIRGSALTGWLVTGVITAIAATLRLLHLGRPGRLVFDETYYVKQAYSLLTLGYEGDWAGPDEEQPNEQFAAGDYSELSSEADYVVHPAVGKWMIAAGLRLLGPNDPVAWRISAAIVGTLSVLLLIRAARRLFGSMTLAGAAGLLLAIDGNHLVMSRISILDIFLSFWALAAFLAVLLDRDYYRRRLARLAATELSENGHYRDPWGPRVGFRPWLLVAGICLGLACGVKWSGIYFLAVFGLLVVAWTITARRSIGVRFWVGGGALRDGVPAFVLMVPVAAATYLLTWLPWWLNPNSYLRQWAATSNATAANPVRTWLPDWLNSWWEYHLRMWDFHNTLTSEHTYQSHPIGWLIQWRPTSFAWRSLEDPGDAMLTCGADRCSAAILSVGNPVIWWGAAVALIVVVWAALRRHDWRAWAILAGYAAGYLPWFAYAHRTIFTFYTVAFVPFVVLALTYALGELIGPRDLPLRERRPGIATATGIVVLAVLVSAFYWPIWTNQWVPYWFWRLHILLPTWI
ncbi:MAG: dolichyl-phosphate-mannose--protein mannosyltransferase [Beutenbergiaceae bacterium]